MGVPKPSEASIVLRHYEDGKLCVFVDGKPLPGVISASFSQDGGPHRDVLNLSIIGLAVRLETSPHKRADDPDRQRQPTGDETSLRGSVWQSGAIDAGGG